MIVFDANIWIAKFDPLVERTLPPDPNTGEVITHVKVRIEALLGDAKQNRTTVLIPTPVLSEILVYTEARRYDLIELISQSAYLKIGDFDQKSAIELAEMNIEVAKAVKDYRTEEPYQKSKLDRQIVAIAKANSCSKLYTTDRGLKNFAERVGLDVRHLADIPIPDSARQADLF